MEKTIKISGQNVKLNNNIGWAICYRDQFGKDVIPTLMPMFAAGLDVISGLISETGKTDSVSIADLAEITTGDRLIDMMVHLGGLEFVDFINITWALAKCADDSIPDPNEWVRQFDEFPVDVIAPAVVQLIYKGVVSSKNRKRLETLKTRIQPSTQIQSSSQESSEG